MLVRNSQIEPQAFRRLFLPGIASLPRIPKDFTSQMSLGVGDLEEEQQPVHEDKGKCNDFQGTEVKEPCHKEQRTPRDS